MFGQEDTSYCKNWCDRENKSVSLIPSCARDVKSLRDGELARLKNLLHEELGRRRACELERAWDFMSVRAGKTP